MATALSVKVNYVDPAVLYATTAADYITMVLTAGNDYLIWTAGYGTDPDDITFVGDLMTHEPTAPDLNRAATIIGASPTTVAMCLLMDKSHDVGGAYYTHKVLKDIPAPGALDNQRYVFAFSFNGPTASEPQLEAWDDSTHTTIAKHVLGAGKALNSFVKAVCTNLGSPGAGWPGTALAGGSNVLLLNNDAGALSALGTGITSQELYCNLKIIISAAYATPAAEEFVFTVRFTYV